MLTEPYHPMSSTLWNRSVILGIAVAMIVWSRATSKTARQRATIIANNFHPVGYSGVISSSLTDTVLDLDSILEDFSAGAFCEVSLSLSFMLWERALRRKG
jgi:hypothetical protein